ncbi:transporter substrate-binding domain-containing diguanylate cyclase [Alteromonas oceanisediminis]|uniref:transporter substrate-binding domain-containing diguanylate cyclase n=1 Tax=Alteromonas oceanisediminis TaxID=2836180 RepID=UPI001BD94FC4|nr:GGDEF domain-containing protein [Alteromonas oceanisediminis]MBT0587234.1 GGDEF domain-containing protein [Alteromonas oceanisediminis]
MRFIVLALMILMSASSVAQDTPPIEHPRPVLHYCVDPDWMPYEAIRNNVHVGISHDYIRLFERTMPYQFKLIVTESWAQTLEKAKLGECDFVPLLNRSPSREDFLVFTDSYFTSPNVLVSTIGSPHIQGYEGIEDQVIGVVKSYRHGEYISRYYPHIALREYATENQALQALADGRVDLTVGSLLSVNTYVKNKGFENIQVVGLAQPHDHLRVGVSKRLSQAAEQNLSADTLVEQFNQTIDRIPEQSHVEIYKQWNNIRIVEHRDYQMMIWPIVVLLVFLMMLLWRTRSVDTVNKDLIATNERLESLRNELLEKNAKLEFLSMHDPLTGLYNRNFMIQRAEEAVNAFERFQQPVAIMIIDVDFFKAINDKYGHAVGDKVLKRIAHSVQQCLREVDIIARWGGEEFLVLCPNSDCADAKVLAERMRNALRGTPMGIDDQVTCSFGIAQMVTGNDFNAWFEAADSAMYRAKDSGRNRIEVIQYGV